MESRLAAFEVSPQDFLLASLTADAADKAADDGGRLANVHIELWRHGGVASASLKRNNRLHVVVPADVPDDVLMHCAGVETTIGISAPAAVANIQRALQESLWRSVPPAPTTKGWPAMRRDPHGWDSPVLRKEPPWSGVFWVRFSTTSRARKVISLSP